LILPTFLEEQGRAQEAEQLYEEIGRILRGYAAIARLQIMQMLEGCYELS
jgi:hypothetical protein